MNMNKHGFQTLKTHREPFAAILSGIKKFEIRKNDRNFAVGQKLRLIEWNEESKEKTGRKVEAEIIYLVPGGKWGLPDDICVFGFRITGDN